MSFLKYVQRETKHVCHVRETASSSLQAILKKNGNEYTKTYKNTELEAALLIRWINQTYSMEANSGLLPNLEQRKPYDVSDVIEEYKNHPTPEAR
jgi:hypothetical protein